MPNKKIGDVLDSPEIAEFIELAAALQGTFPVWVNDQAVAAMHEVQDHFLLTDAEGEADSTELRGKLMAVVNTAIDQREGISYCPHVQMLASSPQPIYVSLTDRFAACRACLPEPKVKTDSACDFCQEEAFVRRTMTFTAGVMIVSGEFCVDCERAMATKL